MTIFAVAFVVLVALLYALIASINHGDHLAPQAYYRRKRGGAPLAHGFESLVPRYRKKLPELEPSPLRQRKRGWRRSRSA